MPWLFLKTSSASVTASASGSKFSQFFPLLFVQQTHKISKYMFYPCLKGYFHLSMDNITSTNDGNIVLVLLFCLVYGTLFINLILFGRTEVTEL